MIFDKKLTRKPHIELLLGRCENALNFLRSITKVWWGADPKICLIFYKAYLRSIIDYGSIVYGSAANTILKKVDIMQNKALRICIGAMCSTPIGALLTESNEPPLDLRRKYLSAKFLVKSRAKNSKIVSKVCDLNVAVLTKKYWKFKNSPPLCTAWIEVAKYCKVIDCLSRDVEDYFAFYEQKTTVVLPKYAESPEMNKSILHELLGSFSSSVMHIYTDASKSKYGVGGAFYLPISNYASQFRLPNETSIFTAEAYAILKALSFVESQNIRECVILADSQSVLKAI